MGNNNEQEAADLATLHNEGDNLFEVIYRGGCLDNNYEDYDEYNFRHNPNPPHYNIPTGVNIRLLIHSSVTRIDYAACKDCDTLLEVVFHENVIEIGYWAFWDCSNLRRVELPEGLLRLLDHAFLGCGLREIVIPASIQLVDTEVFAGCVDLQSVVFIPRTTGIELRLGSGMFWECHNLRFVTLPPNVRSIPIGFLLCCTSLTHLHIPVSVTEFGVGAFERSGIQAMNSSVGDDFMPGTIILPPNLQSIPESCFMDCKSLTHIRMPPSVQEIGPEALNGSDLRYIEIPDTVHRIGQEALRNCSSRQQVTFYSSTTLINIEFGRGIFRGCSNLRFVTLPQNVRSIPVEFFDGCTSLTYLQIPVSVTEFGESAFKGSAIQVMNSSVGDDFMPGTIILPPRLRSIPVMCFMNCRSLTHIRIPPSVQEIGSEALNGSDLRSIVIPETVREIGREAWRNCSSLERVTFHSSSNLNMANNILGNCPLLSVIKIAPWLWPKLFASMNGQPDFIFRFYRQYHTQIVDFDDWWVMMTMKNGRRRRRIDCDDR